MNSPLARALREAAADALPDLAFLKRDRGDALFVTDAPRLRPGANWQALLAGAGFLTRQEGGLLRLWPDATWPARLEADWPLPPDALCESLLRFRGLDPEPESLRLFALGAKLMDGAPDDGRYDRLLRQRAAACLRLNRTKPLKIPRGGGLYACALLDHILKEEN